ncbi:MAG: hypothetical protein QF511_11065, partial [Rhodospirillales bacterium]|nr:hypothetical protein [Rhodospirillales bacterium]MDP7216103.1 hypothetical protein [Rhodospirillales bacterium]
MRIAVILAGFLAISPALAEAGITGRPCVIDGDSLAVGGALKEKWCRGGVEVRPHGIDAPEWDQTCTNAAGKEWARGRAAKRVMARLAGGKIVVCQERLRDVPAAEVRSRPQSRRKSTPSETSQHVKGCRTPAVAGHLRRARSAGVGQASGEETAGRVRLGGSACATYGDL